SRSTAGNSDAGSRVTATFKLISR
ncbi:MAG: hypothetical protein RL261_1308, partial [Pseudomonadota bacterium]